MTIIDKEYEIKFAGRHFMFELAGVKVQGDEVHYDVVKVTEYRDDHDLEGWEVEWSSFKDAEERELNWIITDRLISESLDGGEGL